MEKSFKQDIILPYSMNCDDAIALLDEHKDSLPDGSYLAHVFFMDDGRDEYQIGFVDPNTHEVIVFVVSDSGVSKNPPAEAFKEPDKEILPLLYSDVTYSFSDAIADSISLLEDKYPNHPKKQVIVLLQTLSDVGQVFNITVVTETFYMLNVKIDASNGDVVSEKFDHLMSLKQDD